MMFLYIHGFLSSSQSAKAQWLKQYLIKTGREKEWVCPDLPPNVSQAMQLLIGCIEGCEKPIKLVGSSLGGFFATVLSERYALKAILINPAVHPGLLLQQKIGIHKAWHSDKRLVFTQEDANALNQLDLLSVEHSDNLLVMLEKADGTLDYRQAMHFYSNCHQVIFNGGDHSFTRFQQMLPLIDSF